MSYEDFHRQDYFLPVDYQEKTVRLGLGQTLGNILSLYTSIEKGKREDNLLSSRTGNVEEYSLMGMGMETGMALIKTISER